MYVYHMHTYSSAHGSPYNIYVFVIRVEDTDGYVCIYITCTHIAGDPAFCARPPCIIYIRVYSSRWRYRWICM